MCSIRDSGMKPAKPCLSSGMRSMVKGAALVTAMRGAQDIRTSA